MPGILFTSVYRPFDTFEDGSNMMDLYAGRLTKGQEIFTFESYYPPLPLHLIAQNISTPSVVLENPTLSEFLKELRKGYDYVGIHFAASIFYEKVLTMCRLIKRLSPKTKIILGGYGVVCLDQNFEQEAELRSLVDYVCRGEGIRFMRELLGDPVDAPIRQDFDPCPLRILGVRYYFNNIISALGCRGACEFCATSAFFHYRKVRLISPAELWSIMKRRLTERRYGFIWIFDEDFFDDPDYVRELARLIDREKTLTLDRIHWGAFASVRALSAFTIDELVRMGVQSLWIGIESKFTHLPKRQGRDIVELFDALHAAGITTVGSFIVGWDHHTPENLDEDIAHVVRLNPTFSQISSLMPCPGTRLWKKLEAEKRLRTEGFRWKGFHLYAAMHDHLRLTDQEVFRGVRKTQRLLYEINGPSVLRSFEVYLQGYRWCKNHQDPRIRERTAYHERWCRESRPVLTAVRLFLPTPAVREKVERLRREYLREFGPLGFSSRVKSYLLVLACLVGLVFRKLPRPPKQPPYKRKVYPGIKSFPKPAAAVAGKELEKQAAAPETEKTEPLPVIPGKPAC